MDNKDLSKILTDTLNKAISKQDRIYTVGGKKCRLVKKGNKWTRVEIN